MKIITEWWGLYMIPESDEDLNITYELVNSEVISAYEDGILNWLDKEKFNKLVEMGAFLIKPEGTLEFKAQYNVLEIHR